MKFEDVKNLIILVRENDISEVEIEEPNLRVRIRRGADAFSHISVSDQNEKSQVIQSQSSKQVGQSDDPLDQLSDTAKDQSDAYDEDRYKKVYAPLVGTYYRAPAPDADNFVEEGDVIQKGTVICIIEAMKVMNEIESEHSGKIVAMPLENSAPVEYGEPICIIDPFA